MEITAPKEVDYNPSVTIITAKDIKDSSSENLSRAIRMAPGIMYNDNINAYGGGHLRIRGQDQQATSIYIDGIPVEDIFKRQDGLTETAYGVSSIQIAKGFTSPTYGLSQMAGAVNVVTGRPQKELEISLSQKLIYGRNTPDVDEIHQGISVGTKQDKFYFRIDASHEKRQTYPYSYSWEGEGLVKDTNPYADTHNNTIKLKFGITPNENHEYSLNYSGSAASRKGLLTNSNLRHYDWHKYDRNFIYLLGNSFFTPDFSLNSRVYFTELVQEGKRYDGDTLTTGRTGQQMSGRNYSNGMGGIFTFSYDIYKDANVKFGANFKRHYLAVAGYNRTTNTYNVGSRYNELFTSEFLQYAQRLWDFRLVAALNYDWAYTLNYGTYGKGLAAQAALYYDFIEGHSAHLMVGRKHSMPSIFQRQSSFAGGYIPNPDLEPETGIIYEIGYDINLESTTLNFATFYQDLRGMIVGEYLTGELATACSNGTGCRQMVNAPEGYMYGGEISIQQGLFNDMLVLGANYSYTQKKPKDTSDGNRILSYPSHMANAKVALKPITSLEFLALYSWQAGRYQSYNETTDTYTRDDSYITIDLGVHYYFDKGFNVGFDVTNVADRDNTISGVHLVGRRYMLGVEYNY